MYNKAKTIEMPIRFASEIYETLVDQLSCIHVPAGKSLRRAHSSVAIVKIDLTTFDKPHRVTVELASCWHTQDSVEKLLEDAASLAMKDSDYEQESYLVP